MSLALQFPLSDLTFFYCSCSTFLGIIKDLLRYKEPEHSWHCHPVSKKHNCSLFWLIHLFWWGMEREVHCGVKEEDWKQLLLSPKTIKLLFSFWKDVLHYTSKTCVALDHRCDLVPRVGSKLCTQCEGRCDLKPRAKTRTSERVPI